MSLCCMFLKWFFVPPPCFRSHASSAMLRCANGHPRTLPLRSLPQLPQALCRASLYASCVWTRLRSPAPAAVPETSKIKVMTRKEGGSSRRAGHHVNVTLKVIFAAMAPGALGASSFGTKGAHLQHDATPLREATGTLAKSRISHQSRQSKNLIWINKKMYEYIHGYI